MDDEDSKIRRNFIAVSVFIVLAWWLQAPLDKISEKILGMSSVGPSFEWRAWVAATLALIYFGLRFRFSKEHVDASSEMKLEVTETKRKLIERWLGWEAAWYVKREWTPPVFGDGFVAIVGPRTPKPDGVPSMPIKTIEIEEVKLGRPKGAEEWVLPDKGELYGQSKVTVTRQNQNGTSVNIRERVGFELNTTQRRLFYLWVYAWSLIYSKASTTLAVPWLLGPSALLICLFKLRQSW